MPYEDSSGCLWTEHLDDEGYLFYFNEKTQVSEWELPQGAKEAGPTAPTPAALVPSSTEDTSSCWIQVLDESTNDTFFYNTSTQVGARCATFRLINQANRQMIRRMMMLYSLLPLPETITDSLSTIYIYIYIYTHTQ
ncbi:unnamed protein product [Ascophyllum nodosum]